MVGCRFQWSSAMKKLSLNSKYRRAMASVDRVIFLDFERSKCKSDCTSKCSLGIPLLVHPHHRTMLSMLLEVLVEQAIEICHSCSKNRIQVMWQMIAWAFPSSSEVHHIGGIQCPYVQGHDGLWVHGKVVVLQGRGCYLAHKAELSHFPHFYTTLLTCSWLWGLCQNWKLSSLQWFLSFSLAPVSLRC